MVDFSSFKDEVMNAASNLGDTVSDATEKTAVFKRFAETGRDLYLTGAVTSHGGNLSERDQETIWITKSNSMLGRLGYDDVLGTTWEPSRGDADCSRELVVHRAMHHALLQRPGNEAVIRSAVVHAHTRYTIARSLSCDSIVPIDSEGLFTLGDAGVPVFAPDQSIGSAQAAEMIARAVASGISIAVIKGHGPFAIAPTLAEAHRLVSVLEASCQILDICRR